MSPSTKTQHFSSVSLWGFYFSIKSFVIGTNCSDSVLLHRICLFFLFHHILYYNHDKINNRYICISLIMDYHIIWNMTTCDSLCVCREGKNLYILFLCLQLYVTTPCNIFHTDKYFRKSEWLFYTLWEIVQWLQFAQLCSKWWFQWHILLRNYM